MAKKLSMGGVILLALAVSAGRAQIVADSPAKGQVAGMLFGQDMKTPLMGAVVKLKGPDGQKRFESRPTDSNGTFMIEGVDQGTYILGISSPEGDFNFDYNVLVKNGEIATLSLGVRLAGEPSVGEMSGAMRVEKDPVPYFEEPDGMAILSEGVADTVISCIHKPKPPKPPKSKHHRKDRH